MTLDDAKRILSTCSREELRDDAFGDREVYWMQGELEVACGYFGADTREVQIDGLTYCGDEADQLANYGIRGLVEQNA